MTISLPPLVTIALAVYFAFSIWNAYSTGCNRAMLRKHNVKGIIQYGPYLSLAVSFIGVMLVVFLLCELVGYYSGILRFNIPADLANLDFFTFLIKQFSALKFSYRFYVEFIVASLAISAVSAYIVVKSLYDMGNKKITGARASSKKAQRVSK